MKTCPDCNGEGVIEKGTDEEQRCPTCGGSGFVPDDSEDNEKIIRTQPGHVEYISASPGAKVMYYRLLRPAISRM